MKYVSENYIEHSPAGSRSNKDAVDILKIIAEMFDNLNIEIMDIFAENGMVATRIRYDAVHTGVCMGIPPTGKHISFEGL